MKSSLLSFTPPGIRRQSLLASLLLLPLAATAQDPGPTQPALPKPAAPVIEPAPISPILGAPADAVPAPVPAPERAGPSDSIMMNFQGAALSDVLNYLSDAAGFVIVQEIPVTGTVNIVSRRPINADEAVDLLNSVLVDKGYVALRNNRILKIVSRKDVQKRDLPVFTGSDPERIPRKDEMVTQILPLRYGEATKLVENIRPLLAADATITANEASNAILLTDTQTNIRRIALIVRALDTSVSSISSIQVYQMRFADAKQVATVVTQLFSASATGSSPAAAPQGGGGGRGGRGGGFGGFGGAQAAAGGGQSQARQAATRVVAVADEQSNSLIVSAPEEMFPSITDIVQRIDTNVVDLAETRVFRLQRADATELAGILMNVFAEPTTPTQQQGGRGQGQWNPWAQQQPQQANAQSQRSLRQAQVMIVGDPRTNSLVVNASRETMGSIAEMIGRLDATDAKRQRVFVHSLEHADADTVANVLRGMLGQGGTGVGGMQTGTNRLTERTTTGASMDTTAMQNSTGTR